MKQKVLGHYIKSKKTKDKVNIKTVRYKWYFTFKIALSFVNCEFSTKIIKTRRKSSYAYNCQNENNSHPEFPYTLNTLFKNERNSKVFSCKN